MLCKFLSTYLNRVFQPTFLWLLRWSAVIRAGAAKLVTFEEQLINDETLPFLEASDLLELGVSPMAILAIVDISSAAREKSKKLDAEDVLHDVATHQSVLEKELAEHRAEIARLRMNRRGEVPDHMCCPILMDVMRDPVMAADGHTYEKVAIEQWFLKARTSPTTNEPLASLALLPNHAIRCAIAGRYAGNTYPCQLGDAWWWSPGFGRDDCPEGGFFRRPAQ